MKKINYEKLEKSITRLKEQYENFSNLNKQSLSEINKEAVKESVIQRFETCYDTLWKTLKKYLQEELGLVLPFVAPPKVIFRKFREAGLIDAEDLNRLFGYIQLRIGTAHDYSLTKVEEALDQMEDFIQDASHIYKLLIENK
ncbi:MAG: nucleotidyltransferase substrate binding protein [Oligoflexia bacterium]|nr:nucleotidyltransferase substrate binding protein [Oligoflexia bacterium]